MRVCLVKPPMVDGSQYYEIPLNLCYLAASLLSSGHSTVILDAQLDGMEACGKALEAGFDVIGTTTYSYSLRVTEEICALARAACPEAVVLLGGPHASFAAEATLRRFTSANAVLCGESEKALVDLCNALECGSQIEVLEHPSSLVTRTNLHRPPVQEFLPIDEIHPASKAFDLINLKRALIRNPFVPVLASRGCVYRCTFCLSPASWGKMRIRSWALLRLELERYRELGISYINFLDDVFSLLRPILPDLLQYLGAAGFRWGCETRLDDLSADRIEWLCSAGMERIRVSVETIHSRSLQTINKHTRACDIRNRIRLLTSRCPDVQVSFMVGIPGETRDDIHATMDFAETLFPANCRFWAFSPLPGTPIFANPRAHGITRILPHDQLSPVHSFIETDCLRNDEINDLLGEASTRFERRRTISLAESGLPTCT